MAQLPAKLECATPEIDPGGVLDGHLLVYNATDVVDEVTVTADGPFARWVTVTPSKLSLLPETEGRFQVIVDLAPDAPLEAGPQPLSLVVWSGLDHVEPSREQLEVTVSRRTAASLRLEHVDQAHGRSVVARVCNTSNHRLDLEVRAEAPVEVHVDPAVMPMAPFSEATALVTPRLEPGGSTPVPVTVGVAGDGIELVEQTVLTPPTPRPDPEPRDAPRRADGHGRHRQILVAILGVLAALAVVAWLTRDRSSEFDLSGFPQLALREPRPNADDWERTWQLMLLRRGYGIGSDGADGRFGPDTEAATLQFQDDEGLDVDGVVHPEDWTNMLEHYSGLDDASQLEGWIPRAAEEVQLASGAS